LSLYGKKIQLVTFVCETQLKGNAGVPVNKSLHFSTMVFVTSRFLVKEWMGASCFLFRYYCWQ